MKIAIAYDNGQIAEQLAGCSEFLLLNVLKDGTPIEKQMLQVVGGSIGLITTFAQSDIDVLICGEMGVSTRNALEGLGVLLIPGAQGVAEDAAARFLCGELKGDDVFLNSNREEDPDDPMNCMHDCSKCAGCGPVKIPEGIKDLPEVK